MSRIGGPIFVLPYRLTPKKRYRGFQERRTRIRHLLSHLKHPTQDMRGNFIKIYKSKFILNYTNNKFVAEDIILNVKKNLILRRRRLI